MMNIHININRVSNVAIVEIQISTYISTHYRFEIRRNSVKSTVRSEIDQF